MKHLKRFNENSNNTDFSSSMKELFHQEVLVRIPLNYLLKDITFLILTKDGKIYEFISGEIKNTWNSDEEFKNQTGASLNNEYAGNKSEEFLNFIKSIDYDYVPNSDYFADYTEIIDEIDSVYFQDEPNYLIKNILNNY